MFERWVEGGLLDLLEKEGVGCIPFSPLAQGLLTNKYLRGIPEDSRAAKSTGFLQEKEVTAEKVQKIQKLNELALKRDQTLAQMALAWILRDKRVTSVLIGVSRPEQVTDSLQCFRNTWFSEAELQQIEDILR
jgi:L-glyceraldehyde 3-phosphate reductase